MALESMLCCAAPGAAPGGVVLLVHGYGHGLVVRLASHGPATARDERDSRDTP